MLAAALLLALLTQAGDAPLYTELRFHRVHLRNGNFIDGNLVRQTPGEVVLKLKVGEMSVRRDLIERVEFVKMKGIQERQEEVAAPAARVQALPEAFSGGTPTTSKTPKSTRAMPTARPLPADAYQPSAALKAKVDAILERLSKAGPEQVDPIVQELVAMEADTHKYLASLLEVAPREALPLLGAVLNRTKTPSAAPYLARLIAHPNPAVRVQAIVGLGANGESGDAGSLVPALKDAVPEVRAAAVTSLGTLGGRDAFDPLAPLGADADREVRTRALSTLSQIATENDLRADLVRTLGDHLSGAPTDVQIDLLGAIGRTGIAEAAGTLVRYLNESSVDVRIAAVNAVSAVNSKESADDVVAQMGREQEAAVRVPLAAAAARLGATESMDTLADWLDDASSEVKKAAHGALKSLSKTDLGVEREKWEAWLETRKK